MTTPGTRYKPKLHTKRRTEDEKKGKIIHGNAEPAGRNLMPYLDAF